MKTLSLRKPDDWHVHFRDGDKLIDTVNATAKHFGRALVMPNLIPALTTPELLLDYRQRVIKAISTPHTFTPYFTLYINESVTHESFALLKQYNDFLGAKLYPAGATTNSSEGPTSLTTLYPLFETMQSLDLALQIHGETREGDIFDRESIFLTETLQPILKNFPKLRVVLEHISTKAAVDFVTQQSHRLAATITPHHLLYNRNHLLAGGLKPHYYCLPILKRMTDQHALITAATSGNPKFFAGTDSAPHAKHNKETSCGCAGIFSSPHALCFYASIFDKANALSKLNAFMSQFGAEFYQLPLNESHINLVKKPQTIPQTFSFGNDVVIPMGAGESLSWSVVDD